MRFLKVTASRMRGAWWKVASASVVGILGGASSVGLVALIHRTLAAESGVDLGLFGLGFAALCILVTCTRIASRYLLTSLGQGLIAELRLKVCAQIVATPLRRLEELGPNRLLATLTTDVNVLMQALLFIPVASVNTAIVVCSLGYLAWLDVALFALLVVVCLLGIVTYQLTAQLGFSRLQEARDQEDELFAHFRSLTEGIKELQLHRQRRGAFAGEVKATTGKMRRLRVVANVIYGAATAWGHLLFFVVIGILLYARPPFLEAEAEILMGFTLVLLYMMTPLQTLLNGLPIFAEASVATDKMRELGLTLAPEEAAAGVLEASSEAPSPAWQCLELLEVSHAYRSYDLDRDFVLGPLDLTLEPGEVVFLVGGNGSGKTTLAKLLVGLYAPDSGRIRLDGRTITHAERDDYRQLFSVVFGDFYLFDRLLGFDPEKVDEKVPGYLEDLRLDHKVRVTDGMLSTTQLSQGQRKRLALLTAYLEDRPIYVFDEWAADQDPVFKEVFYRNILVELKRRGKAVVVISHDDRYFHLADRLVKLEDGQLASEPVPADADQTVRLAYG